MRLSDLQNKDIKLIEDDFVIVDTGTLKHDAIKLSLKIFEELIEDPNALLKQIYGDINNYKEKSYSIKNQITTNQGKIKTLFEDYMNGNITSTEYKQFLNQTKKEIENLQIELEVD